MPRLTRFILVLGSVFGFSTMTPATSHAGVVPCVYNALFGQLDILGYYAGYVPAATSYGYGAYGSAYTSYTAGYAPVAVTTVGYRRSCCGQTTSYQPTVAYDAFYGGYSQAYYAAPCCNSCSSGNCSTGNCSTGNCSSGNCSSGSCSNCTVNSAPTSNGYGSSSVGAPTPDYNNNSATSREIIHRLNELEHNQKELQRFLKKQHTDDFNPSPYSRQNTTYSRDGMREEPVPARSGRKSDSFSSDAEPPSADPFISPRRGPAPADNLPDEQDRRKIEINPPADVEDKSKKLNSNGSTQPTESEPQALRLDSRVTTRPVVPKERVQIATKSPKIAVAKSTKTPVKVRLDSSLAGEVVRH